MSITPEYRAMLQKMHSERQGWGTSALRWEPQLRLFLHMMQAYSVLDYGCGKGALKKALVEYDIREFDPGIPGKDSEPASAEIVACLDVMEHIEPSELQATLKHMGSLAERGLFAVIALYPAGAKLPDGRNAHLILESPEWWADELRKAWTFPMDLQWKLSGVPTKRTYPKSVMIVRMQKT